jgi:glycosyltransferase involved in cell wall biosynthesis
MSPDHSTAAKAWRFLRRIVATGRLLRAGRYDLIWTFIDMNNVVTFLAARVFFVSAPIVSVEQTVIPEYFAPDLLARRNRTVMRILLRFVYRRVDRLVALTHAIATLLTDDFGVRRRIDIIYSGVDSTKFRLRQENEIVDPGLEGEFLAAPIRILSVGGLIERKDPAFLVRAMRLVVSAQPGAHLFLLGAGPEEPRIRDLIQKLGLSESVHVLGWRANVEQYIRFADVSVLASRADPLPQALLESLMSGVPVVTTRSTSEWDRVLSETWLGRVVDVRDEGGFARAILEVIGSNTALRRDDIAAHARALFDRASMAEEYAKVLDESLSTDAQ